jgi:hypothetical protein
MLALLQSDIAAVGLRILRRLKIVFVTGSELDNCSSISSNGTDFSFHHQVQAGCGAHPIQSLATKISLSRDKMAQARTGRLGFIWYQ